MVEIHPFEEKCYLCGRTEEDFLFISEPYIKDLQKKIDNINTEIERIKNQNLDYVKKIMDKNYSKIKFSFKAIKADPRSFMDIIPELNTLLYLHKEMHLNDSLTVNELIEKVKEYDGHDKITNKLKKDMKILKEQKAEYHITLSTKIVDVRCFNRTGYRDVYHKDDRTFVIHVCPICKDTIYELSPNY